MSESSKLSGLVSKLQWTHQISGQNEAKSFKNVKLKKKKILKIGLEKQQFHGKHYTKHAVFEH
jgi:hypothetical protein